MARTGAQIAALPLRRDGKGDVKVLMVTSRDTGRWVVPKGWVMEDRHPWEAAALEALEEAGVTGHVGCTPVGVFHYDKRLEDDAVLRCRVDLYPMLVETVLRRWKERDERRRKWFSLKGAAKRVQEPDLSELLLSLAQPSERPAQVRALLDART